jgi:hypothetical protein
MPFRRNNSRSQMLIAAMGVRFLCRDFQIGTFVQTSIEHPMNSRIRAKRLELRGGWAGIGIANRRPESGE